MQNRKSAQAPRQLEPMAWVEQDQHRQHRGVMEVAGGIGLSTGIEDGIGVTETSAINSCNESEARGAAVEEPPRGKLSSSKRVCCEIKIYET